MPEVTMIIKIWEVRNSKGVSLVELARDTGISKSTLNNYENNKIYPNLLQLERIATALDCRITDLFDSERK